MFQKVSEVFYEAQKHLRGSQRCFRGSKGFGIILGGPTFLNLLKTPLKPINTKQQVMPLEGF